MGLFNKKTDKPFTVKHVSGLEIPTDIICEIAVTSEKINIQANAVSLSLSIDRINDISYEMDVDENKYTKSSKLGGVIGAATFGVSGAIVGSAPKTKTERKVTTFLIVNYSLKSGDNEYIIFKNLVPNDLGTASLYDAIKPLVKNNPIKTVEL